jgi:endonuclease YncB( thermonuclease family)
MRPIIAIVTALLLTASIATSQPPEPGIVLPCKVIEVYDGDTVTVEIRLPVRVRMLDCWAPELRDEGGEESRDHLAEFALDKDALLEVRGRGRTLGDAMSFNRVLGRVWIDETDISVYQVEGGHATESR